MQPTMFRTALGKIMKPETVNALARLFVSDGRRHWKGYALAFFFMGLVAGSTAALAYLMGDVINRIFVEQSSSAVWLLSGAVIALSLIKGFSAYGQAVVMGRIGNSIVAENQKRVIDQLLHQDVAYFATRHTAEISLRINQGAQAARNVLNLVITSFGRDLFSVVGLVGVMIVQDAAMAVVGLVALPIAVVGVRVLIKKVQRVFKKQYADAAQIMSGSVEAFQGIRTVKSFNLEDPLRARIFEKVGALERASNKMVRVQSQSGPMMEALAGVAIGAVIMYAGYGVLHMSRTPGEFFSVITALLLCYEPAKRLARLNIDLATHLLGAQMLFEVLDSVPAESGDAGRPALKVERGRIVFEDVVFGYRAGEPVLRGLSFTAEPGETTALVGPSGGGKTTVMNLLERFYDPESGTISIDGQSITGFSRHSVRAAVALVSQDVFLFSGTVRDNIAYGRPGATDAQIEAAARAAHAHDFIASFAQGYDSLVGEHGTQLSGGQRQRLAIARAFLKDAPILLLDEATAALDSESEAQVQLALRDLQANRTTLVIAHRLQTVVNADRICVIDAGRVVESGRHDDLMSRRGRYYTFHQLQFADQRERLLA